MPGWVTGWELWGLSAGSQGVEPNAKDDTLYYGSGASIAALATDLSQYQDNQTTGASWHYEPSPASRFNVTTTWCMEVDVTLTTTDTGRFFNYSNLGIRLSAGGAVEPIINGGLLTGITLPGIAVGAKRYVICWATEPNLTTTGAADAVRTRLYAFNVTDGTFTQTTYTHVIRTAGTADFIWWASSNAGANTYTGTRGACRFSAGRVRTPTETHEDFVAATAEPGLTMESRVEFPIVDPACALGDAGALAGPAYFMGAQAVKQNNLRLFSPIVNEDFRIRPEIDASAYSPVPTQHLRAAPDSDYTLLGNYLYYRPVPPTANRLRCRVFVKAWNNEPIAVRMYSMNRPPDGVGPFLSRYAEATVSNDHGSGGTDGEWANLGLLEPMTDQDGCTWLALAVTVLGNPSATVFEIGSIVVEPGVV